MYHDIAEVLIQEIEAGLFPEKLPTEEQLRARFQVSRDTIHKAIELITQKGLVRRIQGSGYFINHINVAEKTVVNLSLGYTTKRKKLTSKIITFDKITADASLTERYNVALNTPLTRIVRLRYLNDELYNLETAYYVDAVVPFISNEAATDSIFEFIRKAYGIYATSSDQYLAQEKLTATEAELLHKTTTEQQLTLYQTNYYGNQAYNLARTIFVYPDLNLYFHITNKMDK
ncbi:GntR family transcriptional regulator [Loigolactobacillus jiayinensis]|uniref:GntR family transcriptional regulator n=1 Tax=Loigolactobacillus jiayinensis TaxID=2486016 RepID=A0ABW1RD51_9LACO